MYATDWRSVSAGGWFGSSLMYRETPTRTICDVFGVTVGSFETGALSCPVRVKYVKTGRAGLGVAFVMKSPTCFCVCQLTLADGQPVTMVLFDTVVGVRVLFAVVWYQIVSRVAG